LVGWLVDGLVI